MFTGSNSINSNSTEAILEVSQEVEKLKEKAERLEMEVDKFKI